MNPKISVIIPCYNYGQFIDEAVDSVLNQTFQDFEVIIVNDGSTDTDTNKKLENYNKPKVKVLVTENQGLPIARNNGIKISTGEFICCLDADDKYDKNFLQKCLDVFEKDTKDKLGIVTTWIQAFGASNEIWEMGDYNPIKLMVGNDGGVHVASMFRKKCWDEVGGYPENLTKGGFEDRSFWISIVSKGYKWECIKEPLLFYRVKENSMIHDALNRKRELFSKVIANNLDYYKENLSDIILYLQELNDKQFNKYKETRKQLDGAYEDLAKLDNDLIKTKRELDRIKNLSIFKIIKKIKKI